MITQLCERDMIMVEITYLQSHGMHYRANRRVVDERTVLDEARKIYRRSGVRRIQAGGWEWEMLT